MLCKVQETPLGSGHKVWGERRDVDVIRTGLEEDWRGVESKTVSVKAPK